MENFTIYNPTKVFFGKGVVNRLPQVLEQHSSVLLLYGTGSVLRNGIYDAVKTQLSNTGIKVFEFSGILSNPVIEHVNQALELVRAEHIEAILAVGGGSVIDSAKAIAAAAPYQCDAWELFTGTLKPEKALPLYVVLTLAATGSEMNSFAVVQNNKLQKKDAFQSNFVYPRVSFLDPTFTCSVPADYTGYGLTDLTAHCLEAYFGGGSALLSDEFVFAIIREAITIGREIFSKQQDYELRARMMYASTMALNNLTLNGRKSGDWGVHALGHVFSLHYNLPHGATLSLVYPAWLKLQSDRIPEMISNLGKHLFGTTDCQQTIEQIEQMFRNFRSPIRISETESQNYDKQKILKYLVSEKPGGYVHLLSEKDYVDLLEFLEC